MDDFERVRTSEKEVTADMIERARKPELEVDPKDVTELLQSYDKTFNRERICWLWMSKENGFLRWNLLLVKIA